MESESATVGGSELRLRDNYRLKFSIVPISLQKSYFKAIFIRAYLI